MQYVGDQLYGHAYAMVWVQLANKNGDFSFINTVTLTCLVTLYILTQKSLSNAWFLYAFG